MSVQALVNNNGKIYLDDPGLTASADILPRVSVVTQTFLVVEALCDLNGAKDEGDYLWFVKHTDGTFEACNAYTSRKRYRARTRTEGGYEILVPGGVVYVFDNAGKLSGITHPCGVNVSMEYEPFVEMTRPRLKYVRHSNGKFLEFQYSGQRLIRVNTPDPSVYVEYGQSHDDLISVIRHGPQGGRTNSYSYKIEGGRSRHWMMSRKNANGEVFTYVYATSSGPTARAMTTHGPTGEYLTWFEYPDVGHTTVKQPRDGRNLVTEYYYDPLTLLTKRVIAPNGSVESRRYDPQLCLVEQRYVEGSEYLSLVATYSDDRDPVAVGSGYNQPAVTNWQLTWNSSDKTLAEVTDALGRTATVQYANSLPSEIAVQGESGMVYRTTFAYLANGLLAAVTNANSNSVQYQYDGQGYATNMASGTSLWVGAQYNALGYPTNILMPGENGVRTLGMVVDEHGRPLVIKFPNGESETNSYDGVGRLTNHVDVAGRVSRYAYRVNELVKEERVFGAAPEQVARIEIGYDQQMNTRVVRDELGREVERYVLDDADRVLAVTNLEGKVMTMSCGVLEFLRKLTRFDGSEISFKYNGQGQPTELAYPDGVQGYQYLANGLLASASNEVGVLTNRYDKANRMTHTWGAVAGSGLDYTYYPAGQVAELEGIWGRTSYSNDALDRVSVISNGVGQFTIGYNRWNGQAESLGYPNGLRAKFQYDVMNRVTGIEYRNAADTVVMAQELGYDAVGMITTNRITGVGGVEDRRYA
ncbi:MAG: hypothetical protein WCO77_09170, partial [bacterium]